MGKIETKVDTKTQTNPDGSITKTVTTTTTETMENGSKYTNTKCETFTENNLVGGSSSWRNAVTPRVPYASEVEQQRKSAKRIKNTTDRKFILEVLQEHNKLRAKHGIDPMAIDEDLNNVAQALANKMAKNGAIDNSTDGFGRNFYWFSGGNASGARIVQAWFAEIKNFNFKKIDRTPETGHFTQVIWKSSTRLGVALATARNEQFVVAVYNPPGNVFGKYSYNIFPPK